MATRFVTEPETEVPYRVRIAGCESGNIQPEAMLLDDIERVFDGEEHRCVLILSTGCPIYLANLPQLATEVTLGKWSKERDKCDTL